MTVKKTFETILAHGLTVEQFCQYQRAMPAIRQKIHKATVELYENGMSINMLSGFIKANGFKGDRDKARRMLSGADVEQLPAHYSPDELATIKDMLKQNHDYQAIADFIGRSVESVNTMACAHKINMKIVNPAMYQKRLQMVLGAHGLDGFS